MPPRPGSFTHLHRKLIEALRIRVANGEISERRLAVQVGISQPHLHNVLKGTRSLSLEYADAVLERLGLTVLDLLDRPAPLPNPVS